VSTLSIVTRVCRALVLTGNRVAAWCMARCIPRAGCNDTITELEQEIIILIIIRRFSGSCCRWPVSAPVATLTCPYSAPSISREKRGTVSTPVSTPYEHPPQSTSCCSCHWRRTNYIFRAAAARAHTHSNTYARTHARTHTLTHSTHTDTRTLTLTLTLTHVKAHARTHSPTHASHTDTHTHTHTHPHTRTHTHTETQTHTPANKRTRTDVGTPKLRARCAVAGANPTARSVRGWSTHRVPIDYP
jgi:hypothetical protein